MSRSRSECERDRQGVDRWTFRDSKRTEIYGRREIGKDGEEGDRERMRAGYSFCIIVYLQYCSICSVVYVRHADSVQMGETSWVYSEQTDLCYAVYGSSFTAEEANRFCYNHLNGKLTVVICILSRLFCSSFIASSPTIFFSLSLITLPASAWPILGLEAISILKHRDSIRSIHDTDTMEL